MRRSNWIACILLFAAALNVASAKKTKVPALFVFGDSLVDAGTNVYVQNSSAVVNFPPYGETYFRKSTGRFTNGRTVADFLAQALHLPLVKPYLQPGADHRKGANFASGGSGLLDSSGAKYGVVPFKQQIQQFQQLATEFKRKYGEHAAQDLISESLFLVAVGSNDILNYLSNSTFQQTVNVTELVTSLMQIYGGSLVALHAAGARKFVISGLASIGCTPNARLTAYQLNQTGCLAAANQLAFLFNAALANLLSNLRPQLQDVKILHANAFNLINELISNGKQYGFAMSTTSACCGAGPFNALVTCGRNVSSNFPYKVYNGKFPSKYLFWDYQHPTEAAYKIVFEAAWLGNSSYIQPYNIQTLISHKS